MIRMNNKEFSVNTVNYAAIGILEKLQIDTPSEPQINLIEQLILLAIKPDSIDAKKFATSIKTNDKILQYIFKPKKQRAFKLKNI